MRRQPAPAQDFPIQGSREKHDSSPWRASSYLRCNLQHMKSAHFFRVCIAGIVFSNGEKAVKYCFQLTGYRPVVYGGNQDNHVGIFVCRTDFLPYHPYVYRDWQCPGHFLHNPDSRRCPFFVNWSGQRLYDRNYFVFCKSIKNMEVFPLIQRISLRIMIFIVILALKL